MRVVLQRVDSGSVCIDGEKEAGIDRGLVIFLAVSKDDGINDASWLAKKIVNLRIFPDQEGKMNLSLLDIKGQALIVSQFTLYAECEKGLRPSYSKAAPPQIAKELYEKFVQMVKDWGIEAYTGVFQADMMINIINNGPVTIIIDSKTKR